MRIVKTVYSATPTKEKSDTIVLDFFYEPNPKLA